MHNHDLMHGDHIYSCSGHDVSYSGVCDDSHHGNVFYDVLHDDSCVYDVSLIYNSCIHDHGRNFYYGPYNDHNASCVVFCIHDNNHHCIYGAYNVSCPAYNDNNHALSAFRHVDIFYDHFCYTFYHVRHNTCLLLGLGLYLAKAINQTDLQI